MIRKNINDYLGIQLGCFNKPAKGWLNTDITPNIFISRVPGLPFILNHMGFVSDKRYLEHKQKIFKEVYYLNLLKKLPFPDSSVKAYFSSHVIEHLPLIKTKEILKEIFRTLQRGGYVRFVLPDLEYALSKYSPRNPETFLNMIFENQQIGSLSKNEHKWMFTYPYMEKLLSENGFTKVWKKEYRESNYIPFIELDNRPENSFFIEAQK